MSNTSKVQEVKMWHTSDGEIFTHKSIADQHQQFIDDRATYESSPLHCDTEVSFEEFMDWLENQDEEFVKRLTVYAKVGDFRR